MDACFYRNIYLIIWSKMNYMINDELTGTFALVTSETKEYPIANTGMIGIITAADIKNDIIYIGFGTGEQTRYTSDALLVLKKPSLIYFEMMQNATKIETPDFKQLFRVCMLLDSGLIKHKRNAIEMARDNEVVRGYSMSSLAQTFVIQNVRKLQSISF